MNYTTPSQSMPTSPAPAMGNPSFNAGQAPAPVVPTQPINPVFDPNIRFASPVVNSCVADVNTTFSKLSMELRNSYSTMVPQYLTNAYNTLYNLAIQKCSTNRAFSANGAKCRLDAFEAYKQVRDSNASQPAKNAAKAAYDKAYEACSSLDLPTKGGDVNITITPIKGGTVNTQSTPVKCMRLPSGQYFPAGCNTMTNPTAPSVYSSPMKWGITIIIIGVVGYLIYQAFK